MKITSSLQSCLNKTFDKTFKNSSKVGISHIKNNKLKGVLCENYFLNGLNGKKQFSTSVVRKNNKYKVPKSLTLPDGTPDYMKLILTSRVYDVVKETPTTSAINLSTKTGAEILLKREDLQPVFSFKIRGAYNKIAQLTKEERKRGVIACSAGNHAQGVAYGAKHLGIPATIVMPLSTPAIKHKNVSRLGSKVLLHGEDFEAAKAECARLSKEFGYIDIPPFDDPYVIAGQGTIAMEILRQVSIPHLKAVYVSIGGGGLIAGISLYLRRIAPHVKIIGVETFDADDMKKSIKADKRVQLDDVGLFSEGTAVKIVGEETFRLCKKYVDDIILVNTDEVCAAIKDIFEDTRAVVEPAGALAVAGMKKYLAKHKVFREQTGAHCAIVSGANMNFDRLRFVAERAALGEGKEAFLIATIPECPGSFSKLISAVLPRMVTEFSYRYSNSPDGKANIYISFIVNDRAKEIKEIKERVENEGMTIQDISENEMAKSHGRYLIGAKTHVPHERIYSFEFPERPGALSKFLEGMKIDWNITLFHYRNYGADVGQILAAMAVPPADASEFEEFLQNLGYSYKDESRNPVYKQFMQA